jgi:hypothetical protein
MTDRSLLAHRAMSDLSQQNSPWSFPRRGLVVFLTMVRRRAPCMACSRIGRRFQSGLTLALKDT